MPAFRHAWPSDLPLANSLARDTNFTNGHELLLLAFFVPW